MTVEMLHHFKLDDVGEQVSSVPICKSTMMVSRVQTKTLVQLSVYLYEENSCAHLTHSTTKNTETHNRRHLSTTSPHTT